MAEIHRQALLPHPPKAVYELVNDVARYPEFVPGCTRVDIHSADEVQVVATLHAKARGLSETFTTKNTLTPYQHIGLELLDGPFTSLSGDWRFQPLGDAGCKVELALSYELGSMLGRTLAPLVGMAADRVLDAFVARARAVCG